MYDATVKEALKHQAPAHVPNGRLWVCKASVIEDEDPDLGFVIRWKNEGLLDSVGFIAV